MHPIPNRSIKNLRRSSRQFGPGNETTHRHVKNVLLKCCNEYGKDRAHFNTLGSVYNKFIFSLLSGLISELLGLC